MRASVDAGAYLAAGVLFGLPLWHVNAAAVALVFGLSLLAFSSIGVMSATFTLVFKPAIRCSGCSEAVPGCSAV